jgi:hypothetical protein
MNCTDAYREALTRDFSSTASSAPASTPAPTQRQVAEAGRQGAEGRSLQCRKSPGQDDLENRGVGAAGVAAGSGPAMVLAQDATVGNGEVSDQR